MQNTENYNKNSEQFLQIPKFPIFAKHFKKLEKTNYEQNEK
jgi:hypothetical protein